MDIIVKSLLKKLDNSLVSLSVLNADYLLILIHPDKKMVLPVYCILTPHHFSEDESQQLIFRTLIIGPLCLHCGSENSYGIGRDFSENPIEILLNPRL